METTEQAPFRGPVLSHDGPKDKARNIDMVLVEVENTVRNLTVPHGHIIDPGVVQFTCYEDQVPALEAMVETDLPTIDAARRAILLHLDARIAELAEGSEDPDELRKAKKTVWETDGNSVQAEFHRMTRRDILPLRGEVKVLKSHIPEPQRMEGFKNQSALTQSFAEVMSDLMSEQLESMVEKRVAEVLAAKKANQKKD